MTRPTHFRFVRRIVTIAGVLALATAAMTTVVTPAASAGTLQGVTVTTNFATYWHTGSVGGFARATRPGGGYGVYGEASGYASGSFLTRRSEVILTNRSTGAQYFNSCASTSCATRSVQPGNSVFSAQARFCGDFANDGRGTSCTSWSYTGII